MWYNWYTLAKMHARYWINVVASTEVIILKKTLTFCVFLCFAILFANISFADSFSPRSLNSGTLLVHLSPPSFDGATIVSVIPTAGKCLKLHIFTENESQFNVSVSESDTNLWNSVCYWHDSGHYDVDLVPYTNGGVYYIMLDAVASNAYCKIYTIP